MLLIFKNKFMPPKNMVIPHTHFRVAGADNYNYSYIF